MKPKIIVLLYAKQFYGSIARMEKVFNDVVKSLQSEGRKLLYVNEKLAKFEDGTKVEKVLFGRALIGRRVTHLYIDRYAMTLSNSDEYMKEAVLPTVVHGNYKHLDVEGSPMDRIMLFDNGGKLTKYGE
jgi:hypothetical protein